MRGQRGRSSIAPSIHELQICARKFWKLGGATIQLNGAAGLAIIPQDLKQRVARRSRTDGKILYLPPRSRGRGDTSR